MMKRIFCNVIIVVSLIVSSNAFSSGSYFSNIFSGADDFGFTPYYSVEKKVDLHDTLGAGGVRSSDFMDLYVSSTTWRTEFREDLGVVGVEIKNSAGDVMYTGEVNTAMQERLVISITDWPEDTYDVYYAIEWGDAYGSFLLEHE